MKPKYSLKSTNVIELAPCFLFLIITCSLQGQSFEKLSRLETTQTPTFFSEGANDQAQAMAASIDGALAFYNKHVGFEPNVTLLVLSPDDWGNYMNHPVYGMPHYTDSKTLVVASENNPFWKGFLPPLEKLPNKLAEKIRSTYTEKEGNLNLQLFLI